MMMKRLRRDLLVFCCGVSIAFLGREALASNELRPIAITCYSGSISNVTVSDGSMGAVDLLWRSVGAGTAYDGTAFLTDCVLSNQ